MDKETKQCGMRSAFPWHHHKPEKCPKIQRNYICSVYKTSKNISPFRGPYII